MNSTICMTFLILGLLAPAVAQKHSVPAASNDTEQILAAEHAWSQAAVDGNTARIGSLMSDDFLELTLTTGPDQQLHWKATTKFEWLGLLRSGEEKYESVDLSNLSVHLHRNVATVTGEYTQKGTRGRDDISATGPYVDTWIKEGGTWRVVSSVFP